MIWTVADRPGVTVSLTDRALTISRDDALVVAWDRGGRLYSVWDAERTSRRGLNGRVLAKWREDGVRQRVWAGDDEAAGVVDRAAALAGQIAGARGFAGEGSLDELLLVLERAAAFDAPAAAADAAAFREVYRPVGILPPDQYLSLVLQATEGCSFRSFVRASDPAARPAGRTESRRSRAEDSGRGEGGCTFCDFYSEPYRVKSPAQFAVHVRAVVEYLGESIRLRERAVFLGSANALAVPMSGVLPLFDVLAREWPGRPVHAFVDGFTGALKTAEEYRELAARGLRRVYVGLESGCDELLAFVNKPATSAQVVETGRAVKAGGVAAGVIVMLGLGGQRFAEAHVAETARAVNAMALGAGDLLYFSELVESPAAPYASLARAADVRPLDRGALAAQRAAIEARLTGSAAGRPRLATYDVREFVY